MTPIPCILSIRFLKPSQKPNLVWLSTLVNQKLCKNQGLFKLSLPCVFYTSSLQKCRSTFQNQLWNYDPQSIRYNPCKHFVCFLNTRDGSIVTKIAQHHTLKLAPGVCHTTKVSLLNQELILLLVFSTFRYLVMSHLVQSLHINYENIPLPIFLSSSMFACTRPSRLIILVIEFLP